MLNAAASGVTIDVIPDPYYEQPLHAAHHLPPVNADASAERAPSPAYSIDVSSDFAPCGVQLADGRIPLPRNIVPVPTGCPGFCESYFDSDEGVDDDVKINFLRGYSPVTPSSDPEPKMRDDFT